MASYEKGKYSYEYNGKENTIYYNEEKSGGGVHEIWFWNTQYIFYRATVHCGGAGCTSR